MVYSVKEHLRSLHEGKAEHHVTKAKHHAELHKHFGKLAEHFGGMDGHADAAESFQKIASLHKDMSAHHTGRAEVHLGHAKELSEPTGKAMGMRDRAGIVPDDILGTIPSDVPSVRKVLRPGQPDFIDASGVPERFKHLVELSDEV